MVPLARGAASVPAISKRPSMRQGDGAAFADQDVVGPAGRGEIHELEADARLDQRAQQLRLRKALAAAGADDQDLRSEPGGLGQIGLGEAGQVAAGRRRPAGDDAVGGEQQVALVAFLVDHHMIVAVTGDDVGVGVAVEIELHGVGSVGRKKARRKKGMERARQRGVEEGKRRKCGKGERRRFKVTIQGEIAAVRQRG